ncbi:CLUMA_CG001459, isoform A [Clunio marinus]|uniref:CLUMA_CG001459, isoform A n=1 Tax=Clunio marinus TaxID=568069 RepID=A0A1J1HJC6_9DIPT|nr:CLUMA_CG001459, isoform A [Clunio marinus]
MVKEMERTCALISSFYLSCVVKVACYERERISRGFINVGIILRVERETAFSEESDGTCMH